MKKLIVLIAVIVAVFMTAGWAIADDDGEDLNHDVYATSRGNYTTPNEALTEWLNNNEDFSHSHDIYIPTRRDPLGLGLDLTLYEAGPVEVVAEGKHDFANDETSGYLVTKINVFKVVKGILQ